ncbi:MAG: hypothetical protein A3K19_00425 [Lentisphaerae bacterium RIFOXYB12_FULL_65_16]|nr:MAG: hypothetical protein A3K18_13995 [Lentisphaerae bacterium RIFOXYA12_64_32]OGV85338.1 MAG: hypothetical protein A3K19_00425 [Lentisphaerae bacterium RIFOXYB12_FULL_65_16]
MDDKVDDKVRRAGRLLTLLCLFLLALSAWADGVQCAVCGRTISGKYLTAGGRSFCSQACYDKTLPTCDICGRRLTGKFFTSEGRRFCSDACFNKTLPKCEICGVPLRKVMIIGGHTYCETHSKGPYCSHCRLPFAKGFELADGRKMCTVCNPRLIYDEDKAEPLYAAARNQVRAVTGMQSPTLPRLELVGLDRMPEGRRQLGEDFKIQRGMYERHVTTTTTKNLLGMKLSESKAVTEAVLILYALAPDEFVATAAHELTHDLLSEQFPAVAESAPDWVEEGVCQYVSALVCRRNAYTDMLNDIETSTLPDYGPGYRYFKHQCGDNNWPAVVDWMQKTDLSRLPKELGE